MVKLWLLEGENIFHTIDGNCPSSMSSSTIKFLDIVRLLE